MKFRFSFLLIFSLLLTLLQGHTFSAPASEESDEESYGWYKLLEVQIFATRGQIIKAYKRLRLEAFTIETWGIVQEAYSCLTHLECRQLHDIDLNGIESPGFILDLFGGSTFFPIIGRSSSILERLGVADVPWNVFSESKYMAETLEKMLLQYKEEIDFEKVVKNYTENLKKQQNSKRILHEVGKIYLAVANNILMNREPDYNVCKKSIFNRIFLQSRKKLEERSRKKSDKRVFSYQKRVSALSDIKLKELKMILSKRREQFLKVKLEESCFDLTSVFRWIFDEKESAVKKRLAKALQILGQEFAKEDNNKIKDKLSSQNNYMAMKKNLNSNKIKNK